MANLKVSVKRSVRLRGPNLDNGALTKIGQVMVATIKARIAQGMDADGNKALPLSRSYAIFKAGYLKKNRGIGTNRPIRDLSLSGVSMQNYTLRRAADNVIRADATTRMARLKLTQGQQQQRKKKGVTSTLGVSQMFGWMPPHNPSAARLINEIVLGGESDETPAGYRSHYELYRTAMTEIGAPSAWIDGFLNRLRGGHTVSDALHDCGAPMPVVQFVKTTFSILNTASIHEIAAVFTLSREDLVPQMFLRVTTECAMHREDYPQFFYYLDRHIEVDSGSHGPLAHTLLAELCGDDPVLRHQAETAACRALEARLGLWDGILAAV